jgi:hypothetical protein
MTENHQAEVLDPAPAPGPAMALERAAVGREVLMPLDTAQVVEGMKAYQRLLQELVEPSDWQVTGDTERFLKKSGWRKIARAFGLSTQLIRCDVERDRDGRPLRATAIVRAIAPNGQSGDGDGYCSADESRFAKEKGRQKLENDLRATATTRAKNRAISDLVGMGEVSAEERTAGGGDADGPPPANSEQTAAAKRALAILTGEWETDSVEHAKRLYVATVRGLGGTLPSAVAELLVELAQIDQPEVLDPDEQPEPEPQSVEQAEEDDPGITGRDW